MKKALKILCVCCLIISASLIFFACKEDIKTLQTPVYIALVNNGTQDDETGEYLENKYLIVTEKNEKATGYRFFITDNKEFNKKENYVSYFTTENYLDVTEKFDAKKEYHFFVQFVGNDKFTDSNYSNIESFIPSSEKVKTPYVQIVNETLNWTNILNAETYEIYEKIVDGEENIIQNSTKISTLNSGINSFSISSRFTNENYPYYKYSYFVKAIANGYYKSSDNSNTVEYIKHINLNTPTNLKVTKQEESEEEYILSWDEVPYTTKYEIKVNNNVVGTTESVEFNITSYLTGFAGYTFSVKAIESEALDYSNSEYSQTLTYNYTTKLETPTNLEVITSGEYIIISFDYDTMASNGYNLLIKYNNSTKINSNYTGEGLNLNNNKVNISIKSTDIVGELNSNKDFQIYVVANSVGEYIFASDAATINYTILKPE